ncbi:MAG: hypothetical protein V4557_15875 [Bacteroidota bacterium]
MKKFFFLSLLFSAIISTTTHAQGAGGVSSAPNSAAILQQMKEKTTPLMVEKTGLTKAQADKVIELNFEMRMAAGALPNDADRSKKIAELKAAKEKKMSELLTADQIKAVATFYEEMGKNMQQKSGN